MCSENRDTTSLLGDLVDDLIPSAIKSGGTRGQITVKLVQERFSGFRRLRQQAFDRDRGVRVVFGE